MSNPSFPVSVPADQARLIRSGDQQVELASVEGFTESHRGAPKRGRKPSPNEQQRWTGGALRSE